MHPPHPLAYLDQFTDFTSPHRALAVQVTAATTQTMLLLTSSASSVVYAALGDTPWDWAAVMMPVAFVATLAGQVRCSGGCGWGSWGCRRSDVEGPGVARAAESVVDG